MSDERRIYQRLTLAEPIDAWFGDFGVRLIDVSATGALVEYDEPIPDDARALLRFYWRSREIEVLAETARTLERRSGLKFLEESEVLCQAIAASATEMLLALDANARGDRAANVVGEETITSAWRRPLSGFVRWIYSDDSGIRKKPRSRTNRRTASRSPPPSRPNRSRCFSRRTRAATRKPED